jgi:nitrite reductase/ring-hydroxylating ferredoxin subunit/uncharacterized membrane protein
MIREETHSVIDQQTWLEPTGDTIQRAVTNVLTGTPSGRRVDDFLNGVWLGHPLHPVITDVPVGAWTATIALDAIATVTGRTELDPGADATAIIGLLGAVGSAISGLSQWQYTIEQPRRIGLAHALLNVGGTIAFGASILLRARGRRGAGKLTALLGYATVAISSYLGGELAYDLRIGVNHAPEAAPPGEFTPVMPESELPEGAARRTQLGDVTILLVRQQGQIYALANTCSHLGGPLDEGELGNCQITCPWHGSTFSLTDGKVLNGPASFPQPVYVARVRDGQIEVRMA